MLSVGLILLAFAIGLGIWAVLTQADEKATVRASLRQLDGYEVENVRDQELLVPVTERAIKPVMLGFLDSKGLSADDVGFHVLHPGGKKVIDEVARTFGLAENALAASRDCLRDDGSGNSGEG
jgi:predicted naringenin-chalcone synthase